MQSGPEHAPPAPPSPLPSPQRLGPSPPQNWPAGQLPHLTRPPHSVSVTKPQLAFKSSHFEGQPLPLPVPESPPSPTMSKPPPVEPLLPPTLASKSGTPLTTSGLLPQPEATAKVAKTTNRNEPSQGFIADFPQTADEPRGCAHPSDNRHQYCLQNRRRATNPRHDLESISESTCDGSTCGDPCGATPTWDRQTCNKLISARLDG